MSQLTVRLPLQFETIEFGFQIPDGDIICCPACIDSITTTNGYASSLAFTDVTYNSCVDKHENCDAVDHATILFLQATTIQVTTKIDTFKQNSTLHWRIPEREIDSNHEQNYEQEEGKPNVIGASAANYSTALQWKSIDGHTKCIT